jgi:geranylgeranyl transferase type-2 subunit alpha
MHGHKRSEYKARLLDPKVAAAMQHKANQWFKLNDTVLALPHPKDLDWSDSKSNATATTTLELLANMLLVNPDPLYLWQRRRSWLLENWKSKESITDPVIINAEKDSWVEEFSLTRKCLERNPKAYGAWYHRKWCVIQYCSSNVGMAKRSNQAISFLEQELQVTAQFLSLDERNFHGWNYRRFIVACLCGNPSGELILEDENITLMGAQIRVGNGVEIGIPVTKADIRKRLRTEFDFTSQKIQQNFSNGSAFHHRSLLLQVMLDQNYDVSLEQELELTHNAMFTEPDDQTAWWYYDFLLTQYHETIDLEEEKELLEELIDAEGGQAKWALLALFQILSRIERNDNNLIRQKEILDTLVTLDPVSRARYKDMRTWIK